MDQKKIGVFISEIRKEKNMTQKDLSEKLNVSINAVSKWERGICLMDISLLKPLSDILGISIAEIINGEKIDNNELTNEMVEKTIIYYEKKNKENKKKKCKKIFIYLLIIFLLSLIVYKFILLCNIKSIENNIIENNYVLGKQNYHEKNIKILKKNIDNYYIFKDMRLENIFEKSIDKNVNKYVETYNFSNNKKIALQINVNELNNLENLDNSSLAKYIIKNQLTSDKSIHQFLSDFKFEKTSIFSSIFSLKDYLAKLVFYNLNFYTFDDYYELSGSYNGSVIVNENIIIFKLKGYYNNYTITFEGFNLDETISVIETIDFIE